MGHQPAVVDGIPSETAAEVIVHAAGGHLVECQPHHVQRAWVALAVPHA